MTELQSRNGEALVEVRSVKKYFPIRKGVLAREVARVHAVDDITVSVAEGETLGLVGESGCGKSTLGRCIVRLLEPTDGEIVFEGRSIGHLGARALRPLRRQMQMIFQDPYASLNPRKRVGTIISDPMRIHGIGDRKDRKQKVEELLETVGLSPEHYNRFPHEFSGGQRQRIGVARALALRPKLVVADEPVSALDVSIQAEVLNLLQDLQRELGLSLMFISHDLSVVELVADRVMVLYLGRVMETAPTGELYRRPAHPYTAALLQAVPGAKRRRERLLPRGEIPSPANPPSGCVFRTRCPFAVRACAENVPPLAPVGPGHFKACIRDEIRGELVA